LRKHSHNLAHFIDGKGSQCLRADVTESRHAHGERRHRLIVPRIGDKQSNKLNIFDLNAKIVIESNHVLRRENSRTASAHAANKKAGLLPRHVAKATGFSPLNSPLNITPRSLHRCFESRE
jgi:hypothetical protein